jgi:hypothetical protein
MNMRSISDDTGLTDVTVHTMVSLGCMVMEKLI